MESPFATRLALKIIKENFGDICHEAAKALVEHGMQEWRELARVVALPPTQLRAAVQVLLQQNLVNCYLHQEPPTLRGPGPAYHLYQIDIPRVVQSLRQPRFLKMVADDLGVEAEAIVTRLLEHGRMRLDRMVEQSQADAEGGEGGSTKEGVLATIAALINARFVERVPPCSLPPPPQPKLGGKKRGAKPREVKPGSEEEAELLREQELAQLRSAFTAERFKLPPDFYSSLDVGGGGGSVPDVRGKRKRAKDGAAGDDPAHKRSRKKAASAASAAGSSADAAADDLRSKDILWRVNYEEFNRRLRNDAIVEFISSRNGEEAGTVVAGMLKANARLEVSLADPDSTVLSQADIRAGLRSVKDRPAPEDMSAVLDEMAEEGDGALVEHHGAGPGGQQYVLHIADAMSLVRLYQLQGTIRARFGPHGMRIWALLFQNNQLEQKQIADMAMLPKEEARELLYAMLRAGFVKLQDVPRTADHAPSRTFYTWQANLDLAVSRLGMDLHRAAGNLYSRLRHEGEQNAQLLELWKLVTQGVVAQSSLQKEQREELLSVKRTMQLLESGLLELDRDLAIFFA